MVDSLVVKSGSKVRTFAREGFFHLVILNSFVPCLLASGF